MLLETFTIVAFYPLIDSMINPIDGEKNSIIKFFFQIFNLSNISNDLYLFYASVIFLSVFVIKSLVLIFCYWHNTHFEFKIRSDLTQKLYKKYLSMPYEKFFKINSAEIIKNLDYELNLFTSGLSSIMVIITESTVLIGIVIFLFFFNFKVTLILISTFITIIFLLNFIYNKKLVSLGKLTQFYGKLRIQNFIESFNAIKEIKMFGKEKQFEGQMRNFNTTFFLTNKKELFIRTLPRIFLELTIVFAICMYLFFSIYEGIDFKNFIPKISIYLIAAYRTLPCVNRIITSIQRFKFASPIMNNVCNEAKGEIKNFFNGQVELNNIKNIYLKNLEFSYSEDSLKIINKINFKFEKNKIYGVVGESGSGKSTLINLIVGLLNPSSGELLVDNFKMKDENYKEFQKLIGYVPQNTFLFESTIAQNISFEIESKKYDLEKINRLINILGLEKKVNELEHGLETNVSEKGLNLSGGQIQRIGIARALYRNPEIIVLDESTNALDTETEEQIINYINNIKRDKIIILVAHRKTALKNCDKIIKIENGNLLEVNNKSI
tara:strand:- start:215 stop:1864 length:1650 start_codon:yes stop_codon:yes gene_type:complete